MQRPGDGRRDILVLLLRPGELDVDFVGDRFDSIQALCGLFRRQFLLVATHVAGQRDETVADGNVEVRGIDARLPLEFVLDRALAL
jgi:hypothetical protein